MIEKPEGERPTILIVDDTPANIKTLAGMLKEDYKIISAKSGEEALSLLSSSALPDLILLDIMMPGMDGYEVCKQLKADKRTKDIPVIFITAKNEDKQRGKELGSAAYITKPFHAKTVIQIVKTHIWLATGR
jgi:putative two-component system response regulator